MSGIGFSIKDGLALKNIYLKKSHQHPAYRSHVATKFDNYMHFKKNLMSISKIRVYHFLGLLLVFVEVMVGFLQCTINYNI